MEGWEAHLGVSFYGLEGKSRRGGYPAGVSLCFYERGLLWLYLSGLLSANPEE